MDLRVSRLEDTDLVAVCLWPADDPAPGPGCPVGMPLEGRCLDRATAALVEELIRRRINRHLNLSPREMHTLISRAEQRRRHGAG